MKELLRSLRRCPRCGAEFVCQPNDVAHCQCSTVCLTAEDRAFISRQYGDCLCVRCLTDLVQEQRNAANPLPFCDKESS